MEKFALNSNQIPNYLHVHKDVAAMKPAKCKMVIIRNLLISWTEILLSAYQIVQIKWTKIRVCPLLHLHFGLFVHVGCCWCDTQNPTTIALNSGRRKLLFLATRQNAKKRAKQSKASAIGMIIICDIIFFLRLRSALRVNAVWLFPFHLSNFPTYLRLLICENGRNGRM